MYLEEMLKLRAGGKHHLLEWLGINTLWMVLMASFFQNAEGWSFGTGLYFSYITCTTIGFGDYSPVKSRSWPMTYLLICIGIVLCQGSGSRPLETMLYKLEA